MCLNKKLLYDILIKSRFSELLALRKQDFLKLSVNNKGFIEIFLKDALVKYMKLIEHMNNVINTNEYETDEEISVNSDIAKENDFDSLSNSSSNSIESRKSSERENDCPGSNTQTLKNSTAKEEVKNENELIKKKASNLIQHINRVNLKVDPSFEDPRELLLKLSEDIDLNEKRAIMNTLEEILIPALDKYIK
jgi:hypothetical protein